MVINMELKDLIISLSSLMSVTGYESHDSDRLESLIGEYFDENHTDKLGNRIFVKKCGKEGAPRILVDTHMDEIGMFVTEIKDGGFLTVTNVGGVDTGILQASDVVIYGEKPIFGVVGSTPPHLQKPDDAGKLREIGELLIDTGYKKEELEKLVRVGTPVGFAPKYSTLAGGQIAGKGFDNKSCVACVVEGIKRAGNRLAGDVYLMLSSREETGRAGGGALTGAYNIDPDYALVADVNLGRTPDTKKNETVEVGGGVSLTLCPVTDKKLTNMTVELVKSKGIKYQLDVTGGGTATNTPDINLTRAGIPCVDVGLPLKCMHTCAEVIDLADSDALASLVCEFVCSEEIAEVFAR